MIMKGLFLFKPAIRAAVEKSRTILELARIDINDLRNLTFALNWDHGIEYAEAVLKRLEKAVDDWTVGGGSLTPYVEKALEDIAKVVNEGLKYRFP